MPNIKERIVYAVDDKKLDELLKTLKNIEEQTKDINENQPDLSPGAKKSTSALDGLKGQIAKLGIAAAIGAGIKSFAELTAEVIKNRKETALLTQQTGAGLDATVAKIRATSTTFGKDYNEVLRTANSLSQTFKISMTAALDEVNQGFARGLDINGDYLETLSEYDTFIKQAGLNTKQFNILIQEQIRQGVFSDKGIDAIKEAVISLQEMTPATRDAIKAVGLSSDQLIADIQGGTKTYFEAVQEIVRKTNELSDQTVRGQVLADIFRGAGEDAGNFIFTLGQVGDAYAEVTQEEEDYIQGQLRLVETSEDLNGELVKFSKNFGSATVGIRTFANIVGTEAVGALNAFLGAFIDLGERLDMFEEDIKTLEIDQIQKEIEKLEEGPGFFKKLGAAIGGGAAGVADQATEASVKLHLLRTRLEELQTDDQTKKENELADAIERQNKARDDAAEKLRKQKEAQAKKDADQAEKDEAAKLQRRLKINADLSREFQEQQINDERILRTEGQKSLEDELIEQETELNNELYEINKARMEKVEEAEKEAAEKRRELIFSAVEGIMEIYNGFSELRIQQIDNQINANELARNREIELAELTGGSIDAINKKYDDENRKLRNKQALEEKLQAIFSIGVNTARGVVAALASVPPNVVLSAIIGGIGLTQAAFVAAQQPPKFAKGIIDLQGPGTMTSDSILARLSVHESVIPGQETLDYKPTLYAIKNRMIDPEILNNFVMHPDFSPVIKNDLTPVAELLSQMPHNYVQIDEEGMTGYYIRKYDSVKYKANKYSMG